MLHKEMDGLQGAKSGDLSVYVLSNFLAVPLQLKKLAAVAVSHP